MQDIVIPVQTDRHAKCIERSTRIHATRIGLAASLLAGLAIDASADVITDWNDYNEVKALGGKSSARRSAEQTEIARFWEYSLPPIYHAVVRSVANMAGREATQNARLYAAVTQAHDDAMIAVFDAKYHYNFWRPLTAIRSGDIDGNDATDRDASWTPFIDAPMHPEYPSAHSILAGAVGAVLQAEIGAVSMPALTTTSPTAKGAARRWARVDDFVQEVANARVYQGVHYRVSTEVGAAMGKRIGELVAAKVLRSPGVSSAQIDAERVPANNHPPAF